ncbi:MAG TPA: phosphoribosylformylglycinamidine cyclo-ligase [Terriglobales bacterium]|nr:phosphoribosylformylglycinamidine cyclo-ligase [Terriglobales bacterium]
MSEGASPGAKQGGAWEAYRNSGVDIDAGERAVELMRASIAATRRPEVIGGLGGFASAMALPSGMRKPVLVSSTDGVGTKTAIAMALGRYDTIGQDLVAMCADDLVCAGAEPLFFLDYIAVGHVFPERVAEMVASVADGCTLAGCSLIGGETAEHPGLMEPDDFDLAGFCVGVVERGRLLDGTAAHAGDALIGIGSSGLHSNGFSLVRRIVAEADLDLGEGYAELLGRILGPATSPEPETLPLSLGEVLLTPTRIYSKAILSLRRRLDAAGSEIRGVSHITGGGLPGNVPRVLPEGLAARVNPVAWPMPSIMRLIGALGGLSGAELRSTFNGGLGMVAVVPPNAVETALASLAEDGLPAWPIGLVVAVDASGARYSEI